MNTSKELIPSEPIWVEDSVQLAELCDKWSGQSAIAIDTEFMRTTTFYPKAALFQVGDGEACYLVDPLIIDDFAPFKALMLNDSVTKVMHSCSEDLEVFQCFLNVVPRPLFDTQLAAAFVGQGFSLGYARLVEGLLGIAVAKSETRSDWLQRPLSVSQMRYAALDVAYLPVIYGLLVKQLQELERLPWVLHDCDKIVAAAQAEFDPETYYLKVKSAWKLNRQQLACLQLLSSWRECEARERNVPRNRLIKERTLWEMARLRPTEIQHLKKLEGMPPRTVSADGVELLDIIDQAYKLPPEFYPLRLPRPLPPESGDLLKALKAVQSGVSERLNIASEVLLRKKDLEAMVRAALEGELYFPETLEGWRMELMASLLEGELAPVVKAKSSGRH